MGTISFSGEIIFVMDRSGWNSTALMASKHFLKWGCTRMTSFDSDRIDSRSSFDRK